VCTRVRGGGVAVLSGVPVLARVCVVADAPVELCRAPLPTTHLTSLRVALSFFPLGAIFLTSVGWDGRSG